MGNATSDNNVTRKPKHATNVAKVVHNIANVTNTKKATKANVTTTKASHSSWIMKGISYGPSPMMTPGNLPNDDFMCDDAKAQWGSTGRNDLAVIKALGANAIRLYGNDFEVDHSGFLDLAASLELSVLPGISDFPYLQASYSCRVAHGYDCFSTIRSAYRGNLRKGFLGKDKKYHSALKYIIAINEPDMKLPDISQPRLYSKAIVSALDGMLAAEEDEGVVGPRPNFTVAFSFTVCGNPCGNWGQKPALGQMWMLRDAIHNPWNYDYKPKHDLGHLYKIRFTNSFNTGNAAWEIPNLFLTAYQVQFPETPVFIAEYHCPNQDTRSDVQNILNLANRSRLLQGISFFEYMVRHDVGGHEDWGLFYPKEQAKVSSTSPMNDMAYFGAHYNVPCLLPKEAQPALLATAYGGNFSEVDRLLHLPEVCA
jgi:hypothetical protein